MKAPTEKGIGAVAGGIASVAIVKGLTKLASQGMDMYKGLTGTTMGTGKFWPRQPLETPINPTTGNYHSDLW